MLLKNDIWNECYGNVQNIRRTLYFQNDIFFLNEEFKLPFQPKPHLKEIEDTLFPYQKRLIAALEYLDERQRAGTMLGIGEEVGSGKTRMTLLFLMRQFTCDPTTSIIIVPYKLFVPWRNYIKRIYIHSFVACRTQKEVEQITTDTSLILLTDTMVNTTLNVGSIIGNLQLKYVCVDEFDTIKARKYKIYQYLRPKRFVLLSGTMLIMEPSLKFNKALPRLAKKFRKIVVVRHEKKLEFKMPDIQRSFKVVPNPKAFFKYARFVERSILFDINNEINTESELVTKIFRSKNKSLRFYREQRSLPDTSEERIIAIDRAISEIESDIESIRNRLEFKKCPVCLCESPVATSYIICSSCQNSFCLSCGEDNKIINCPMCRGPASEFITITEKKMDGSNDKFDALLEIFSDILERSGCLKAIIYVPKTNLAERLAAYINTLAYPIVLYTIIMRGLACHKQIEKFKSEANGIFILTDTSSCAGLDFQFCDHLVITTLLDEPIETQVIGRCQRMPRQTPFNLYYVLFENEMQQHQRRQSCR